MGWSMKRCGVKKLTLPVGLVVIIAALVLLVCLFPRAGKDIRHIILISIDTCRADYLSCYGYPEGTTPNIDEVANDGVLFEHVITPVPLTLPAHTSMLTGTIPPYHGVRDNVDYRVSDSNVTLAEIMSKNGYRTAAVIGAFVLDRRFGLNQGFDYYNDRFEEQYGYLGVSERRGEEVSRLADRWLDEHASEKFFLFLHYYDPHVDYRPKEPFASRYKESPYAGEIAYADYCIGQVMKKLKDLGIYDSAMIIITADHGEALGEHGEAEHGFFIYQPTIAVPLIIKCPGYGNGKRIKRTAGLVDLVPTVLGRLGIPAGSGGQGKDLYEYLSDEKQQTGRRHFYCESVMPAVYDCPPLRGVITDRWKYIRAPRQELYDLVRDPGETGDLAGQQPQRVRLLENSLKEILAEQSRDGQSRSTVALDAQARARLESLGYVGAGGIGDTFEEHDGSKADPKDFIRFHEQKMTVKSLMHKKQYEEAKVLCSQMIAQHPDQAATYAMLGQMAFEQNDTEKAIEYYNQSVRLNPADYQMRNNLAVALQKQGRDIEAIKHWRKAIELDPTGALIRNNLVEVLNRVGLARAREGTLAGALEFWGESLQLKEEQPDLHNRIAAAMALEGKVESAIAHWQKSLELDPKQIDSHNRLGIALAQRGRIDEAVGHWRQALLLDAESGEVLSNLARALAQQGKLSEAATHYRSAVRANPNEVRYLDELARLLATASNENVRNWPEAVELAKRACQLSQYKQPEPLDTLGLAYAAGEKFVRAAETAAKALEMALAASKQELAEQIRKHMEQYERKEPWLEQSPRPDDIEP